MSSTGHHIYKSCPLETLMQKPQTAVNLSVGLLHVGKGVLLIDMELLTFFIERTSPPETCPASQGKIAHALSPSPAPQPLTFDCIYLYYQQRLFKILIQEEENKCQIKSSQYFHLRRLSA
jgi:hypothetical protein